MSVYWSWLFDWECTEAADQSSKLETEAAVFSAWVYALEKAGKSPDLQLPSQRHKRAQGAAMAYIGFENWQWWWCLSTKGWKAENPGKDDVSGKKNPQWPNPRPEELPSAYGPISLFTPCKPLTDWVRPSFRRREILCALTTDINRNLIQTLQSYPD